MATALTRLTAQYFQETNVIQPSHLHNSTKVKVYYWCIWTKVVSIEKVFEAPFMRTNNEIHGTFT